MPISALVEQGLGHDPIRGQNEMLAARDSCGAEDSMKAHVTQGRTHVLALFSDYDS